MSNNPEKNSQNQEVSQEQIMAYLRVFAAQILEPEAYSRILLIKSTNPQLFISIMQNLIFLFENKKIIKKISEKDLINLASKLLQTNKNETNIIFKRKGSD
jgi:DNA-binding TFAR19-related protein (PDSD5 family)